MIKTVTPGLVKGLVGAFEVAAPMACDKYEGSNHSVQANPTGIFHPRYYS